MNMSLNRRLLLAASIILFIFLGLTGLALDNAFYRSAEQSVRESLQGKIFALLAASDFNGDTEKLLIEEPLPDPRLSSPQSGLYAQIYAHNNVVWKSPSAVGLSLPAANAVKIGSWKFQQIDSSDKKSAYFILGFSAAWENNQGKPFSFQFQVLEDFSKFENQVGSFRNSLWGWLVAATIFLLLAQALVLRWSLKPLRSVATDLDRVKAGEADRLHENYPDEIRGLTQGINTFIDSERNQRDRYRHTLADLAHSLKTPLAVLNAGIDSSQAKDGAQMQEQIERMRQIVDYQLQRASAAGRTTMGVQTPLLPVITRIVDSLQKVHVDQGIQCPIDINEQLQFPGEQGDLFEMCGNLLENAYKWAHKQIRVSAKLQQDMLLIRIEDDGPGIPESQRAQVLQRGKRADETVTGFGIGLSVVNEIVSVYGGSMHISDSKDLGGACMLINIPLTNVQT